MVGKPRGHRMKKNSARQKSGTLLTVLFLPFTVESPESLSWREGPSGHSTLPQSPRDAQCSASSELSGPSTPLHTSSPVQGKERYAEGLGLLGQAVLGCGQPKAGTLLTHLPFHPAAPEDRTPGPPPWHPLRD